MEQPAIFHEGVEIPDFGERSFPYGVIEVTKRCNLRCKTCFFFQAFQHEEKDLPEEDLLAKLAALSQAARAEADLRGGGIGSTLADIIAGGPPRG